MTTRNRLTITQVNPLDASSYNNAFLTFDIDWTSDEVIGDTLNLVKDAEVAATFFVTHQTPVLDELRQCKDIELGLHPKFAKLLDGTAQSQSAKFVLGELQKLVPEALSIRSHSVVQSSRLTGLFVQHGLSHESNIYIPYWTGINVKPWRSDEGIIHVPYCFSDELVCIGSEPVTQTVLRRLISSEGLKVFNFHPIHVFLNTESLDRYEGTRHLHNHPTELVKCRYSGYGTRSRLLELLSLIDGLK
jgi:hypothetical protein